MHYLPTAGAAAKGCPMILSPGSSCSMSEVAAACQGLRWAQIYMYRDREITRKFFQEAERCGFKALTVMADVPRMYAGRRPAHLHIPLDVKISGTFTALGYPV